MSIAIENRDWEGNNRMCFKCEPCRQRLCRFGPWVTEMAPAEVGFLFQFLLRGTAELE